MNKLNKKVAIVTGGGKGLGEQISRMLAAEGVRVAICDIKQESAQKVAQSIIEKGGEAHGFALDVGDETSVRKTIDTITDQFGRLDIVINNAGVDVKKNVSELSLDDWDHVIRVNLKGPFLMTKFSVEKMDDVSGGNIINIVYTTEKQSWINTSAYHASKWGLLGLSRSLFTEMKKHNISVKAIISDGMNMSQVIEEMASHDYLAIKKNKTITETVKQVLS